MRYIEKAVGTLSELENANVLGRLLAHSQEITDRLMDWYKQDFANTASGNPLTPFLTLADSFKGKITQSTLNVCPNQYCFSYQRDNHDDNSYNDNEDNFLACKVEATKDCLCACLHAPKHTKAAAHMKPMWKHKMVKGKTIRTIKVCYECAKPGHIRTFCPLLSPSRK